MGQNEPDPDFPVVGTVRWELHKALDGMRCCIKRVEVVAICESRDEARHWMLNRAGSGGVASATGTPPELRSDAIWLGDLD